MRPLTSESSSGKKFDFEKRHVDRDFSGWYYSGMKETTRIRWTYPQKVQVPERFRRYLWDYGDYAPLERLITRVLRYGDFEEIREIYEKYPEETFTLAMRYPDVKRGVRFWIRRWHERSDG